MTDDLLTGYARSRNQRSGLRPGSQAPRDRDEIPDGPAHAYRPGEVGALCGAPVAVSGEHPWPSGLGGRCRECTALAAAL